ncbi:hypothetical protein LVQ77_01415 [Buttiauxella sp. S04-F03]|uniref:hypothetical protein n=1 Tax=Buttiauxella sp. W03-F01 TaxID=2904524 RepID=UPI001E65A05D|nr:hypothetical protein [Buttiauxella sp. W03-F01]MCE0798964.1 hypothetical protein [Buttiauxella sp. W03-F01]
MKKKAVVSLFITLNIAPWLALFALSPKSELDLYCQVPFNIRIEKQQSVKLQGAIKTHYYADRSAISFISGNLVQLQEDGSTEAIWRINRRAEFTWYMNQNYLHSITHEVHPAFGDNLPHSLAEAYLFPTYKVQHRDYYQLSRLANDDVIVSVAGMPRLYCHSQTNVG